MNERLNQMKNGSGFIAALDQSGGSTPKTLENYGIPPSEYGNDVDKMFELVHQMRVRIMTDSGFARPKVIGAILFEKTMRELVNGKCSSQYLWQDKSILPFLKIDVGLAAEEEGVQLMKPIPNLKERLAEARSLDVFGTKMRSVIKQPNQIQIENIVKQQFNYAKLILAEGLVPIVEPEIDIHTPSKYAAEDHLLRSLLSELEELTGNESVVFKLTLPEKVNFYQDLVLHPRVVRLAALSGGYSQRESVRRLHANTNMIASFSRALTEELRRDLSNDDFSTALQRAIDGISDASTT